jgi:hypothetical protein
MRKLAVIAAAGAIALLGTALPASAATTGDTTATFTIDAGSLSITVPAGPAALSNPTASISTTSASGSLGNITVVDDRGGTTGWVTTASSTDFTGTDLTDIPASGVSYTIPASGTGHLVPTGTVTPTANNPTDLSSDTAVVTATAVTGVNSVTWNPGIHVSIPAAALIGDYSATITHSIS